MDNFGLLAQLVERYIRIVEATGPTPVQSTDYGSGQQFFLNLSIKEGAMHDLSIDRAGKAAVLSLIVPGFGQVYNGHWFRALFWLIITPGFWIGTGGLLGWICHVVSAITAFYKAQEN